MVDEARCSSSGPLKYGVPGADTDCSRELSSAGGPLALDVSDRSDELLMVRPGMPGRRTGERYEAGGLKERAKLAMAASAAAGGRGDIRWVAGNCSLSSWSYVASGARICRG